MHCCMHCACPYVQINRELCYRNKETVVLTHSYLRTDQQDSYVSDSESSSSDEVNADDSSSVANSNENNAPESDMETLQSLMKTVGDMVCKSPSARPEDTIERLSSFYPGTELEHSDVRQNLHKVTKMAETRGCATTLIPILPSSG